MLLKPACASLSLLRLRILRSHDTAAPDEPFGEISS